MSATEDERKTAERFAEFLANRGGVQCSLTRADDPPDFYLAIGAERTWLEVSDIYFSNQEAKFINRPEEKVFNFAGAVDELAQRLICSLNRKLGNANYRPAMSKLGKGMLLLTCRHVAFSEVDLAQIQRELVSYAPSCDQGFFSVAYFEYQLPGEPRNYMTAYPVTRAG